MRLVPPLTTTLWARGAADVDTAWGRYTDLDAWLRWAPQITGVDAASRRLAPGLTGTVHGPLGVRVRFVVEDVDELGRAWSWRARLGPVRLWLHHTVAERPGGGSTTTLTVKGPAPVVAGYVPLAQLAISRLVRP